MSADKILDAIHDNTVALMYHDKGWTTVSLQATKKLTEALNEHIEERIAAWMAENGATNG